MVQTIQASKINLGYLIDKFNIQFVINDQFFTEWLAAFSKLSDREKQALVRIKSNNGSNFAFLKLTKQDTLKHFTELVLQ